MMEAQASPLSSCSRETAEFFSRHGHGTDSEAACISFAQAAFPTASSIQPVTFQGYCSFTLCVDSPCASFEARGQRLSLPCLLQFRPQRFRIPIRITTAAKQLYEDQSPIYVYIGSLHPSSTGTKSLIGDPFFVYAIQLLQGVPLANICPRAPELSDLELKKRERTVRDLARFLARPLTQKQETLGTAQMHGRIGSTLLLRLEKLAHQLPSEDLRGHAAKVLAQYQSSMARQQIALVLNHGDMVPTNMLIDSQTGALIGLCDWGEAEILPAGTSWYGLEYLLGFLDTQPDGAQARWVWHSSANELRDAFWNEVRGNLPGNRTPSTWKTFVNRTCLGRDLGVLLWFGFAWDDGRIDRVVQDGVDDADIICLKAFLSVDHHSLDKQL